MGVDASDFRKLTADLSKAPRSVGNGAQVVVRKSLVDGVAAAKNRVPVDTGNLKGSIGHSDLRTVGTKVSIHEQHQHRPNHRLLRQVFPPQFDCQEGKRHIRSLCCRAHQDDSEFQGTSRRPQALPSGPSLRLSPSRG